MTFQDQLENETLFSKVENQRCALEKQIIETLSSTMEEKLEICCQMQPSLENFNNFVQCIVDSGNMISFSFKKKEKKEKF